MLRKIIRENVEDLGVDWSVNRPTKLVKGRTMSDPGEYAWASPSTARGFKNPDTFDLDNDEMHIFDFDDTLGEGFGPTLVAAVVVHNGVLRPITNFINVLKALDIQALNASEAEQLSGFAGGEEGVQGNTLKIIKGRWFAAPDGGAFNGAEVVTLDTAAFADFRAKFSKVKSNQSLVIPMDVGGEGVPRGKRAKDWQVTNIVGSKGFATMDGIPSAIKGMEEKPDGSVLIAYDFSPSLTLGDEIERYDATNKLALDAQAEGEPIGVITARKGVTEFDSFSGTRPVALNAEDMQKFLQDGGLNWTPNQDVGGLKFVHGAADYSNDGGKQKARLAKGEWLKQKQKHLRFYDDDKRNARAMSDLCDDEEIIKNKSGGSINIYSQPHGGFKKQIGEPVYSCRIGENKINLSESQFRKLIRKMLLK